MYLRAAPLILHLFAATNLIYSSVIVVCVDFLSPTKQYPKTIPKVTEMSSKSFIPTSDFPRRPLAVIGGEHLYPQNSTQIEEAFLTWPEGVPYSHRK
jgi:hypothetical protein